MKYLKGIGIVLFMIVVQSVNAQVVIKESIELGTMKEYGIDLTESVSTQNHIDYFWDYYQHPFIADMSGELSLKLIRGESFLQDIDTVAYLKVSIWGKAGRRDTTIKIEPFLGDSLKGKVHWRDTHDWYLYGPGPFLYEADLGRSEEGKDATVRLHHDYTSEFLGYDCSSCCPCKPIYDYTYKGERTNENLGNFSTITASVYDWGGYNRI